MSGDIKVSLSAEAFVDFLEHYKTRYAEEGVTVEGIILSSDVVDLLTNSFFNGNQRLIKEVKHRTDRKGKIVMTIAGIRVFPTTSVDMFHPIFILGTGFTGRPNGSNPIFPTTGPGAPPDGGSPVAIAKAA